MTNDTLITENTVSFKLSSSGYNSATAQLLLMGELGTVVQYIAQKVQHEQNVLVFCHYHPCTENTSSFMVLKLQHTLCFYRRQRETVQKPCHAQHWHIDFNQFLFKFLCPYSLALQFYWAQ